MDDRESSVWDMLDRRLLCTGTYNPEDEDEMDEAGEAALWFMCEAAIEMVLEDMLWSEERTAIYEANL